MTTTTTATPIARTRAVKDIAAHLADRDTFVLCVDPTLNESAADALHGIDATIYVDNGTELILRTNDTRLLTVMTALIPCMAVFLIPKTVPAAVLSEALGEHVPDDGSRDIVMLGAAPGRPMFWSLLFVDALQRVDPQVANTIRAAHIPNTN